MPRAGQQNSTPERRAAFLGYLKTLGPGTDCVMWPWSQQEGWYSSVRTGKGGKRELAHRWVFEQINGEQPPEIFICHRCDNPPCVRPSHLFAGTHQDNMNDAVEKMRIRHGETHPHAKLTDEQVETMRRLFGEGVKQVALAAGFGVSKSQVHKIVHGEQRATGRPKVPEPFF